MVALLSIVFLITHSLNLILSSFSALRVTVSALLSLVGPAHQLLLALAAFKRECDVF